MEAILIILVVLAIAVAIGRYWQYVSSKKKIEEKERNIEINEKARELNINKEYDLKMDYIERLESVAREKSKAILDKAVDYAFNFEKEIREQHNIAENEIQKVLDDGFRFKRKVLLSSITLKNHARKFDEIKKEKEIYKSLLAKRDFFSLKDNSDWPLVEKEYRDKVIQLQLAQDEKEAQDDIKRQMREERQRAEDLEKQQQEAEDKERSLEERKKYIELALLEATEEHKKELEEQREKLEKELEDVHKQYERAKSMAQMTKQGHVYIISNIGSFGENVFKVGMTRRLEPMERVNELSNASVPFEFDVHAMISCDDAPSLEKALHDELMDHRINKVNLRKEFFKTDIEKIIHCVEKHHGIVDYLANPVALQYNRTIDIEADQKLAS
ncbi:chromosome segregation ATPase [Yersinia frederiksenii]|nr:chromosome segregation ATPase [Yersinia frederiksenii]